MDPNQTFPPNMRGYLEEKPKTIKAYSKSGKTFSKLPNNVIDPIVANNIATWEFDNTSKDLYKDNFFE